MRPPKYDINVRGCIPDDLVDRVSQIHAGALATHALTKKDANPKDRTMVKGAEERRSRR